MSLTFSILLFDSDTRAKFGQYAVFVILLGAYPIYAAAPQIISVYPPGTRIGNTLEVEIWGKNLKDARSAWFDCDLIRATVHPQDRAEEDSVVEKDTIDEANQGLTEIESEEELTDINDDEQPEGEDEWETIGLTLNVDAVTTPGTYSMRIISSGGISNALKYFINNEPTLTETEFREREEKNDGLPVLPVFVNGQLEKPGEVDRFEFEGQPGDEFLIEATTDHWPSKMHPFITLYQVTGSWFDENRLRRITSNSRTLEHDPRLTCRFEKSTRYVVELGAMDESYLALPNSGGTEYVYQLKMRPVPNKAEKNNYPTSPLITTCASAVNQMQPRNFARTLGREWMGKIRRHASDQVDLPDVSLHHEVEPNGSSDEALAFTIPSLIEGIIQTEGDKDVFKFVVEENQKLAFEIETPYRRPPQFNPRISIRRADEPEIVNNLYKKIGGDGDDWVKTIEPKVIHTFKAGGEYILSVGSLTPRAHGDEFAYRILIRPQLPHVSRIATSTDCLNLGVGQVQTFHVQVDREEEFVSDVAFSIENLPPGVTMYPAVEPKNETPPPLGQIVPESFRPESEHVALMIHAAADAPATTEPHFIRIIAMLVNAGHFGESITAGEIPLMVLN